ncbi:chitobiase/beta-hexosaminidase C-terminal domain-containing protein [Paenibacillus cremeus]|uniref:SLH domain-containing protein n=1 Tax=Paenibacillus cremeus TaxID=2163881 RepID=A0A559K5H1_9BACL|nr:FN3 associated domain-containing protein [Paenibacillus cremeus]TVY07389.1 hypothetical protein FPZ49_24430 [Paenibacillus cremeus]
MARRQKSIIAIVFAVLVMVIAAGTGAYMVSATPDRWTDHADVSWYNPTYTTFKIDSAAKLAGVAKLVNDGVSPAPNNWVINGLSGKILEIDRNLDLSAYEWVPIGVEGKPFKGTLIASGAAMAAQNVNTFEIQGMKITSNLTYSGFIGLMDGESNATLGSFTFTNTGSINLPTVTQDVYVGAAVGKMVGNSTVYNIINNVPITVDTVTKVTYAGGIVGQGEGTISGSVNAGPVNALGSDVYAGGITGAADKSGLIIKKVTNNGAITATSMSSKNTYVGGIAGYSAVSIKMDEDATLISNTGVITGVNGLNNYVGGILGKVSGLVTFSQNTTNSGAVNVTAPTAISSTAGGLVGALNTATTNTLDFPFVNTGSITNNGGSNVYTGGIAGYIEGLLTWNKNFTGTVGITASGKDHVYTGGLLGYLTGDLSLKGTAKNTGAIQVSGGGTAGKPDEAYTGGLVGYGVGRVLFDSTAANAYENSGSITVTGGTGVYTGGIVSNRAYATTTGTLSTNVNSTGNISVTGSSKLYTGGFIGWLPADSADKTITGATFANQITVTAAASSQGSTVSTGGVVGYSLNGTINSSTFKGQLNATGGGLNTFTGGIAGYVDGGSINNATSEKTSAQFATITSDGNVGGIAGYLKGTIEAPKVNFTAITVNTVNGFAGGIAGTAQGTINGATVGDPSASATGSSSVKLAASTGIDRMTAGGIVGQNDNVLTVTNGLVTRSALLSEVGRSGHVLGSVAGLATVDAKLGVAGTPIQVKQVDMDILSDNTVVGGAIGINHSPLAYLAVENLNVKSIPASTVKFGGIAGVQDVVLPSTTAGDFVFSAKSITVTAQGSNEEIGGLFGEMTKNNPMSLADNVKITATGNANQLGGAAGKSTGMLNNIQVKGSHLEANGDGSEAGGIVGHSEVPDNSAQPAGITNVWVHASGDDPLVKTTGSNDVAGGIVGYAKNTEIKDFQVEAELPDTATLMLTGAGAKAGGLAGQMKNSQILGDAVKTNSDNVLMMSTAAAANSYIGGIAGYIDNTRLEKVFSGTVNMIVNSPNSTVGGMAGYNLGSNTAILINNNTAALSLKINPSAASNIVGGLVGLNEHRTGDPVPDPSTAVSTIQNSRYVGTLSVNAPSTVTGGMVGENRSLIANGSISDKNAVISKGDSSVVGGLVGLNTGQGTLYYDYSNANLTVEGQGTLVGGLIGENRGQVIASYVDIDITSAAHGVDGDSVYLGGLVGRNSGTMDKSYSVSKVTANGNYTIVGGLVGEHASGSITNSYAAKEVIANGDHSYAGGLLGRITNGTVTTAYSAGRVSAVDGSLAGGFAGRYDSANRELLYKTYYVKDVANDINADLPDFADGSLIWLYSPGRLGTILTSTLQDRSYFPGLSGWDFNTTWRYGSLNAEYKYPELIRTANSGGDNTGSGSDVNANINWYTRDQGAINFEIKSEAELAGLAAIVNGSIPGVTKFDFAGRTIKVTSPIHIQSKQWVPIGATEDNTFQGTFNGNSLLIDGLNMPSGDAFSGLFGVIGQQGKVMSIKMEPLSIAGGQYAGALAGVNKGTVTGINVSLLNGVKISGATVGGMIGKNTGSIASLTLNLDGGSRVEGVGANAVVGGVIGDNTSTINPSVMAINSTDGSVGSSAASAIVGGFIGKQAGDVTGFTMNVGANYRITSSGASAIIGGVAGKQASGKADSMTLSLTNVTLEAQGDQSILGGVIGQSDANNVISNITVTTQRDGQQLTGTGVVGGIVGMKDGKGANAFDLDNVKVEKVVLATTDPSTQAVLGGIAGKLNNAALRQASMSSGLKAAGAKVTAGGIAGEANDSILYMVDVQSDIISSSKTGETLVGGVAGVVSSSDINKSFDFGKLVPFYRGIYNATVSTKGIKAVGLDNGPDLFVGGIAGKNQSASIYHASSATSITVSGAKTAAVGGIAGYSSGIMVNDVAHSAIAADTSRVYHVGGVVGQAAGGEFHYSNASAAGGESITVGSAVTKPDMMPSAHVGGFVGMGDSTKFTNDFADIPVKIVDDNQDNTIYAGGFAGMLGNIDPGAGVLERAYAKGSLSVQGITGAYAGGFVGSVDRYTITDAYAIGDVSNTGFDTRSGGFAGIIERAAVVNRAFAAQSKVETTGVNHATRSYAGGFAGYNDGVVTGAFANVPALTMNVSGANVFSGVFIGYNFRNANVTGSSYLGVANPVGRNLGTAAVTQAASDITDSYAVKGTVFEVDTAFLSLSGTLDVAIYSAKQLDGAVLLYNDSGLPYYQLFNRTAATKPSLDKLSLGADITVESHGWVPFAVFNGEFDGKGHTIKGLHGSAGSASAYGFVTENNGTIANVTFADAAIAGGNNTGIVASINHSNATISGVTVSGTVKGSDNTGAVAGTNDGMIMNAVVKSVTVEGASGTGAVTGINHNGATINGTTMSGTNTVKGSDYTGGIAGKNEGVISEAAVQSLTLEGANYTGGVAGLNSGKIVGASVNAAISSTGTVAGIVAGANEGQISKTYAAGTLSSDNAALTLIRGGIAGENKAAGEINQSFSMADINLTADQATVGGIAGVNHGTIRNTYNSGRISAKGTTKAWAGGIAGYAIEGIISDSLNYGEITAAVGGKIVSGQSYFGGIAGQKEAAATITKTAFNKQMLKANTAYYDAAGKRVAGSDEQATGMLGKDLSNGSLPANWTAGTWQAVQGFYPQLAALNEMASKLSTSAVIFADKDTVNQVKSDFALTRDAAVSWTADPTAAVITDATGSLKVTLKTTGSTALKVTVGSISRSVTINRAALLFAQAAKKPNAVSTSGNNNFYNEITVTLTTGETGGKIYYTLDGSQPDVWSTLYTAPIVLKDTTTLKAITVAEDREDSEQLSTVWTKIPPQVGGGGGGMIVSTPSIAANIGQNKVEVNGSAAVTVAKNSKLTLTAPTGRIIYYTTDGSTPTKNSPQYNGDLLITGNMTIKMITDQDDKVVTINYQVENAKYDLKADAGQVKYIAGYENNTFKPDAALTRYEMAEVLAPLLDKEDVTVGSQLSDVAGDKQNLVAFFTSAGIIEGYPDNTFGGDKGLSRAEFVVLMSRVLKLDVSEQGETKLSDVKGHWSEKYVNAFTKAGYVEGFPDGTFQPDSQITRAQAVVLINRVIGAKKQAGTVSFDDLPPSHWAYQDITSVAKLQPRRESN